MGAFLAEVDAVAASRWQRRGRERDAPDIRVVTEIVLDEAQTQRIRRAFGKLGR